MSISTATFPSTGFMSRAAAAAPARTKPDPVTDPLAAMVEAAKEGEAAAVESLVAYLRPLIVRYCRARIGKAVSTFASADDVAQEVCIGVLTSLPAYRSTGASFLSFVYGIASHKIIDFHRRYSRDRTVAMSEVPEGAENTPGPEQRMLRVELSERLGSLLDTLPDIQREVLVLRLIVGLSVAETANAVNCSPGAVRVSQHRALAKLRRQLVAHAAI